MTNTLKLTGSDNVTNKRKKYFNAYVEICNLNEAVLLFLLHLCICQVYLCHYSFKNWVKSEGRIPWTLFLTEYGQVSVDRFFYYLKDQRRVEEG